MKSIVLNAYVEVLDAIERNASLLPDELVKELLSSVERYLRISLDEGRPKETHEKTEKTKTESPKEKKVRINKKVIDQLSRLAGNELTEAELKGTLKIRKPTIEKLVAAGYLKRTKMGTYKVVV